MPDQQDPHGPTRSITSANAELIDRPDEYFHSGMYDQGHPDYHFTRHLRPEPNIMLRSLIVAMINESEVNPENDNERLKALKNHISEMCVDFRIPNHALRQHLEVQTDALTADGTIRPDHSCESEYSKWLRAQGAQVEKEGEVTPEDEEGAFCPSQTQNLSSTSQTPPQIQYPARDVRAGSPSIAARVPSGRAGGSSGSAQRSGAGGWGRRYNGRW